MIDLDRLLDSVDAERTTRFARVITSLSRPDGHEGPRAAAIAELLEHPRLDIHVDPVLPGRPNVVVRLRGQGTTPGLLLNGHIDAGFVQDGWSRDPLDPWVEDGHLHGGAVSDMLGGVAAMMETLLVAASAEPLPGDLVLLANMYHDSNGLGTKYALASEGGWPRYGINGEPTSMSVLSTHGGCVKFEVELRGRTAHVSRADEGADAVAAAVKAYGALGGLAWSHTPDPRLGHLPRALVGVLSGGYAPAAVAHRAVLQGDIRTVPGQTWQSVRDDIDRAVGEVLPEGLDARVRCLVRQRAFQGRAQGPLFEAIAAAHQRVRGAPIEVDIDTAAQAFVTDAVDMAAAGIETLVYGPGAWHLVPDEHIAIDEMADAARVYLATAANLMGVGDAAS
jgi:acetylornithine deacetylase/succinyl-diaminopimelate desuccinylase-like protein